ncbi:galectin-1-like [Dromiciops gliroides]|uniref:galectin-1-like n=1 Tax=Dromiciops gliroides TaxID=33562 RepID=UPI001CC6EDC7|nr:galectin-1-like [Dromiciops gliroides]
MPMKTVFQKLNLQPGEHMKILGDIPPDAKHFRFCLGKDEINFALHFNPRFNAYGDTKLIICTSREDAICFKSQKETHFPFVPGSRVEVGIIFEGSHFTMRLPDGFQFTYPNYLNFNKIDFFGIGGDFNLKMLDFE